MRKPFVFGVAVGNDHFIGRKEEIERLSANFKYGVNTILISRRRIGKTSLVNYVANDVIVSKVGKEKFIGRVIAKPGDEVDITKEGKVVINGSLVVENDIFYPTPQYDSEITYPVLLKEDEYFVLCDQRNGAKDSRIYGTIQKRNTKGKVITLLRKNNI